MNSAKASKIKAMKGRERIAALTVYDFALTRLLDAAGIPLLLVGDSLGMVVLGYPDTTHVTMAEMEHHVRAAARARPAALLAADLPFASCATVSDCGRCNTSCGEPRATIRPASRAITFSPSANTSSR